ncbi:hypothetical protein [Bacillus cereus group sp. TH152-1LC]|uniref:hypothetical protein n=1 Tax=Bacillus cereus group sp. TH152-1LC TaxID=3018060 RepID=UPI0022E3A58D|nr:hypothetical protein [Bacillus cereus group sp. TH152-1LC]MDA1674494.1 hypothetical protein [Bacillus cereus group sp. TH152-1LC]
MHIKCNPADFSFLGGKFAKLRVEEEKMKFSQTIEKGVREIRILKQCGGYELELYYCMNNSEENKDVFNLVFYMIQEEKRMRVAEAVKSKLVIKRGCWTIEIQDMLKTIRSFKNDIENWRCGNLRKRKLGLSKK